MNDSRRCSVAGYGSDVRIGRIWLLLMLAFSCQFLVASFVPPTSFPRQQHDISIQRLSQASYTSISSIYMTPSKKTSVSSVRNSTTSTGNKSRQRVRTKNKNTKRSPAVKKSPQKDNAIDKQQEQEENKSLKVATRLEEFNQQANKGENLTQSYCDSVLALCVACDEWDSVLDVVQVMKSQGLQQERSTRRACLQACFEMANGASAHEVLTTIKEAGEVPDATDVSLAVAAMCCNEQTCPNVWWKRAMDLLLTTAEKEEIGVVPVETYDAVLSCIPHHKWREAVQLLHLMEQSQGKHPKPILSSYRAVIETCVAAQQAEQAFQILNSMSSKGLEPTVFSFELVISALARQRSWRRALQLLEVMDDLDIPKTVVTYNTVISACARGGEVGTAKNLLAKMKRQGVKPNVITFNSLMSACASTSRWKDALSLLDQCHREPGVQPDIITYTNGIRACARGRQTNRALTLLQVVKDLKLPIDNYCYTAVIDACAKAKNWRKALDLLNEMEENGIMPNAITYSVAINACGNGGQWEKALALLDKMKEKNMRINLITYNSAITALSKASKMNTKFSPKTNSPTQAVPASSSPKNEVVNVDNDQLWVRALELLQQIKSDGMEPDGFSYSAAISCCGAGGRWKEALDLINIMHKGGPKTRPNKIAYTAAISACGRAGEYEEALKLFADMKKNGLQPDRVAYNAVFSALRIANKPREAFELWKEMCGKKQTKTKALVTANAPVSPDIITLTDVIGTLSRAETVDKSKIDAVFHDAVERGIVMRKDGLDSDFEVDLTGMSLPVARAACRFIFQRILTDVQKGEALEEVTLLTGVGRAQDGTTTSLREYILQVLEEDFDPPMHGVVPKRAQGTVVIDKGVEAWIAGQ